MPNVIGRKSNDEEPEASAPSTPDDIQVHTHRLFGLNLDAQDAVREFALHDIDDQEGIEQKRIQMHDTFTQLYAEVADFTEQLMGEDFDIAYLRERIQQADENTREQLENALKELQVQAQRNLADIWMARVLSWLHQAAASSGPFVATEHEDKKRSASRLMATVMTMIEKPFAAVPRRTDGTQKLRRVALGNMAHRLLSQSGLSDQKELAEIEGKNKVAEAEFHDEFLNELISLESTFRQAFNPFDELVWKDILGAYIYEQATDLYNEAIAALEKTQAGETMLPTIRAWKQNTAGLCEVYIAMTYNDIADAQMRAGNLEDASKLYMEASEAYGRAGKLFAEVPQLQSNVQQSQRDRDHKKAQSLFCKAEASVKELSALLRVDNKAEAMVVLGEIFRDLRKAEKLSQTRELTAALKENLRIFAFVEEKLKNGGDNTSGIIDQIELAKGIRKEGLIQSVSKAMDHARTSLGEDASEALEEIREALSSLGILLSLEEEDEEVANLRNRVLALLANAKYVIQFQLSSQLEPGVKFIMSRILENLHADEASTYYKIIGENDKAEELTDMGKLALATAYASEAQAFIRQSEQWAFRTQLERSGVFKRIESQEESLELANDEELVDRALRSHDSTGERLKHGVASFEAAAHELDSVKKKAIRKKNSVDDQVKQLQGVVMKLKGDISRIEAAKSDFLAEFHSKKGDSTKARRYFTQATDLLREAVGNYTVAAQVFQQLGDLQTAQAVDSKARTTDLLARVSWENGQRIANNQPPTYKGDTELAALYLGGTGSE
ncbi:MAG: hypothetical protein HXY34_12240 [Candidatus Thorarchaeota archaeon]|nr:hypothetical protein [Candidatus Thorarchaeota archaeon]